MIKIAILTSLIAATAVMSSAKEPVVKPAVTGPEAVSKLLKDASTEFTQISSDASALKSYARQAKSDSTSHAEVIERMKNDIQTALLTVGKLNDSRSDAAPWQVDLEDTIIPIAKELADNVADTAEFVNNNQAKPSTPEEFRTYLETSSDLSVRMSSLIINLISYANLSGKIEIAKQALEKRMELSSWQ